MNSKLREALEEIVDMGTCYFPDFTLPKDDDELQDAIIEKAHDYTSLRDDFIKAVIIARTALAEPLRNCDVGTAEEQGERFILFCRRKSFRGVCNDSCKFANVNRRLVWQKIGQARCFPFWSQMLYEKGGVK